MIAIYYVMCNDHYIQCYSFTEPEYDFIKDLADIDAYEKEAAELVCEVNDPMAVVQWYREDKPIDPNDPKYFAISEGNKRKLRVNNVTNRDEGLYKCKVQDKFTQGKLYVARKY